jgi:hypothetical protein
MDWCLLLPFSAKKRKQLAKCSRGFFQGATLLKESRMRTTLAIDDDVLAAAKHLAKREKKTVGEVVAALARRGLSKGTRSSRPFRNGVPLLPTRHAGTPVTLEWVNQLRDAQP